MSKKKKKTNTYPDVLYVFRDDPYTYLGKKTLDDCPEGSVAVYELKTVGICKTKKRS